MRPDYSPLKESLIPYLNSLYVDIKHADSAVHKELTGVGSELIWQNLKRIDESDLRLPVYIRVPLIPGVNDSDTNLQTILAMVSELKKVRSVEILPYHKLGVSTYGYLGDRIFSERSSDTIGRVPGRTRKFPPEPEYQGSHQN